MGYMEEGRVSTKPTTFFSRTTRVREPKAVPENPEEWDDMAPVGGGHLRFFHLREGVEAVRDDMKQLLRADSGVDEQVRRCVENWVGELDRLVKR